jgi:hypothetical protein
MPYNANPFLIFLLFITPQLTIPMYLILLHIGLEICISSSKKSKGVCLVEDEHPHLHMYVLLT